MSIVSGPQEFLFVKFILAFVTLLQLPALKNKLNHHDYEITLHEVHRLQQIAKQNRLACSKPVIELQSKGNYVNIGHYRRK